MPRAIVIQAGEFGDVQLVDLDTELDTLQRAVGGDIEAVDTGDVVFVMDEDGKAKGQDLNCRATYFLYKVVPRFRAREVIVGTVVLFGGRNGEDLSDVPQFAIEHFGLG